MHSLYKGATYLDVCVSYHNPIQSFLSKSHTMKLQSIAASLLFTSATLGAVVKRESQFHNGQPIDGKGKGAPILGMLSSAMAMRWLRPAVSL